MFISGLSLRLELATVPGFPKLTEFGGYGIRKVVNQPTVVQSEAVCSPTKTSQWYIVARHVDPLEAVARLKVAKAILLFLAIRKVVVYQIRSPSVGTGPDRLYNQRICRSLVFVLNH